MQFIIIQKFSISFMTIRTEFTNQERLLQKMYSSAREKVWLLLPDDYYFYNLKLVPEDID